MALYAVLGAGGPVGKLCVDQLLSAGKQVRAIVRNPSKYEGVLEASEGLEIVQGDVTQKESLEAALMGTKGIVFAAAGSSYFGARAVENEGVRNVAVVAAKQGAHIVLVSAALVTPQNWWHPVRILLNLAIRYNMMNEKLAGEKALRESGALYTIVRPGRFFSGSAGESMIVANQLDRSGQGDISMADVAAVCISALSSQHSKGVTVEVKRQPKIKPKPGDLDRLFDELKSDDYLASVA